MSGRPFYPFIVVLAAFFTSVPAAFCVEGFGPGDSPPVGDFEQLSVRVPLSNYSAEQVGSGCYIGGDAGSVTFFYSPVILPFLKTSDPSLKEKWIVWNVEVNSKIYSAFRETKNPTWIGKSNLHATATFTILEDKSISDLMISKSSADKDFDEALTGAITACVRDSALHFPVGGLTQTLTKEVSMYWKSSWSQIPMLLPSAQQSYEETKQGEARFGAFPFDSGKSKRPKEVHVLPAGDFGPLPPFLPPCLRESKEKLNKPQANYQDKR